MVLRSHGRGVVREVVVDLHAAGLAAQLEPAAHVAERGQRAAGLRRRHAHVLGTSDGGQRVHLVVLADEIPGHVAQLQAAAQHVEAAGFAARAQAARLLAPGAEALHLAPAAARQHAGQGLVARVHDHPALRWHRAHEVVELRLDGGEVRKDVGVVVLEVVEHRGARAVVHELAALVEERGVVLVGLDHERRAGIAQPCADAEVQRHAADQEAGLASLGQGLLEDPGQHRGGGGLAMGAGHRQHMAALQHLLGQPLRAARVARAGVENGFHQRHAALDDIADHEDVGVQRQLLGAIAFDELDAERAQLVAHRRVDGGVAACHAVAGFVRQRRQAAHEGAADAQDMNVHASHSRSGVWRPSARVRPCSKDRRCKA